MSLQQLRIANFKAIKGPVEIDFGRLTFLYGPNSAGKSAVLDALDLLMIVGAGNLADARQILELTHRGSGQAGIRLGVRVFVDGCSLSYIGTSKLAELGELHMLLTDGAWIDLDIEFESEYHPRLLKRLAILVNDQLLATYDGGLVRYGPYFRKELASDLDDQPITPSLNFVGEWMINTQSPAAGDVFVDKRSTCARARLAFGEKSDGLISVRGLSCSVVNPRGNWVSIDQESLDLVFPSDHLEKIVADVNTPSSLYLGARFTDCEPKDTSRNCHANYLKQFSLAEEDAIPDRYVAFLKEEFSQENSADLYRDLRQQATKLNQLVDAVFHTVAHSILVPRVPGNRTNIDSNVPVHLKSSYQHEIDLEPNESRAVFSGSALYETGTVSQEFESARRLTSVSRHLDDRIRSLLLPYARDCVRRAKTGGASEIENDFPNLCLKRYLHSLRNYQFTPEIYSLSSLSHTEYDDDSNLADSALVYFVLTDRADARRTFAQVGSGVGYLFPVLTALGEFDQVAVEQPELHLHPLAQDQLADVFVHAANTRGFTRRLIIESHSEVFLLKIAKRIQETHDALSQSEDTVRPLAPMLRLGSDSVRIYYFMPTPKAGTEVTAIRFAPNGNLIDDWPEGMFSKDWTSGLDRMRLFSKEFDTAAAGRARPWIERVVDPDIRKWLATAWFLEKLGDTATESVVVMWGKILEKTLTDCLLQPLKQSSCPAWYGDKKLGQGLHDFFQNGRYPSLGWWRDALLAVKWERGPQSRFTLCLRGYIREQSWAQEWSKHLSEDLIRCLDSLIKARNLAAHSGHAQLEDVRQARVLVVEDDGPGRIFRALGLVKREWPRLA